MKEPRGWFRWFRREGSEEAERAQARVKEGLARTRGSLWGRLGDLFRGGLDEASWEALEEALVAADVGVETALDLVDRLRERARAEGLRTLEEVRAALAEEMLRILADVEDRSRRPPEGLPEVVLIVGVNGVGKTTTLGKLAHRARQAGRQVLLAAADTFRAAAIEQLQVWGRRVGVPVIAHQPGADPGAVAHDAVEAARSRGADLVLIDTAGRLHTRHNLMAELGKVARVVGRLVPEAPHRVLLVLDATTGQNGLHQARRFAEAVPLTEIALTKLDGTARGGIAFAVVRELKVPITWVGVGEGLEDLLPFDPRAFVDALLTPAEAVEERR